jgi:hypothetical protein
VVEFVSRSGEHWVGNFATGWAGGLSAVRPELGPSAVVVVAEGSGYIVDADEKALVREMAGDVQYIWFVAELGAIVVSNGLWFEAFDAQRLRWQSPRVSWDGIRNVACSGSALKGEAFDPTSDKWLPFRLDLASGEVEGGTYSGPPLRWNPGEPLPPGVVPIRRSRSD